jgi:hypothetical protein
MIHFFAGDNFGRIFIVSVWVAFPAIYGEGVRPAARGLK